MSSEEAVVSVTETLAELLEDSTVPRNVKSKIESIISALKENEEASLRINKALNALDEIADDTNLQSYTRTQIWNIVSILEKLSNN